MEPVTVHYAYGLVAVSVIISMVASYAAFSLADRMAHASTPLTRRLWLLGGSCAMGLGIWSMHYLGMVAVRLPVDVHYYMPTVLLSLFWGALAAAVALIVLSSERFSSRSILFGGMLMGAGIGSMHYTGMAAMRSPIMCQYNPWLVGLSILTAVAFACLALWIAFALRNQTRHSERSRVAGGCIMGLGIAAMHYTAMAAVRFVPDSMPFSTRWTVQVTALGESAIIVTAVVVLAVALGTAALDKARLQRLSTAHEELARAQADLLHSQQQLQEANALLSELSIRDGLTGLYNRRHFDTILGTEWRRAVRSRQPISLLMVDVDWFKLLNDHYGHQRGDDCLRDIARVLEDLPRRGYDTSARYGGEEFAVLLPESDTHGAMKVAESIRRAVEDLRIENQPSPCSPWVTISIGVASCIPTSTLDPDTIVRDADTALYGAKQLGRNRVEIASPISVQSEAS